MFVVYCEPRGIPSIGIFPSQKAAIAAAIDDNPIVAEVPNAWRHVNVFDRPVYFTPEDMSWPELNSLLMQEG